MTIQLEYVRVLNKGGKVKLIFKWLLMGVLPIIIYFIIIDLVKVGEANIDLDTIKISFLFSFIPYFALPHFFKLFKELFVMWREGNWLIKIIIPLGLLGVFGRAAWLTGWR